MHKIAEEIYNQCKGYLPEADKKQLSDVVSFSYEARQNAESAAQIFSFSEVCEIAQNLINLKMSQDVIAAGLVHDLYTGGGLDIGIKNGFDGGVVNLIEGYQKLHDIATQTRKFDSEDEYIKMVLSVAGDLNVVLLFLANRYFQVQSCDKLDLPEKKKLANDALDLYAPLAHRLGIGIYKERMETKAFRILHPKIYGELARKLEMRTTKRASYHERVIYKLKAQLKDYGLTPELSGRSKHLLSIYRKMQRTNKPFEQIFDLVAVRAIVGEVVDCYKVLAVMQQLYHPIMEEFDDYIQKPKLNGYQSLHLLLEDTDKEQFELQIRTKEMHRTSEFGVAAHWRYKEGVKKSETDSFFSWLRQDSFSDEKNVSIAPVRDFFHLEDLNNDIFVLTPQGDLKKLPKGATPIDFAFAVHRDVGIRCSGAKVNGQMVSFEKILENGDKVEVLTSNNPTVNQDWSKYAKSSRAQIEIRRWLRKQMREHSIKLGEEILSRTLRKHKISWTNSNLEALYNEAKLDNIEDLFAGIGSGKISAPGLALKHIGEPESQKEEPRPTIEEERVIKRHSPKGVTVGGMHSLMVNFGKCCLPIPGDPIVGYITRGKGITVHRTTCKNVRQLKLEPEREIFVDWEKESEMKFIAGLKVHLSSSQNFIKDITQLFGSKKIHLLNYQLMKMAGSEHCVLVVEVSDSEELNAISNLINSMSVVRDVNRMQYAEFKPLLKTVSLSFGAK